MKLKDIILFYNNVFCLEKRAHDIIRLGDNTMQKLNNNWKILSPIIPEGLNNLNICNSYIEDDDYFNMGIISDCSFDNQKAEHVSFEQIIFKNVIFNEISFKFLELTDVKFINCELSNIDLRGAIIHRTEMIDCKMIGANLSEGTLRNVIFDNCNCSYGFFRFSDLKQVSFTNCLLNNSDFQNSNFNKVNFSKTDLKHAQMSGTKLKDIDLSNCDIEGIGVRIEDLHGAIISSMQAVFFSKLLGLVIKE
jgi:uncharacterized protein YjbI with pentapeptide repeats